MRRITSGRTRCESHPPTKHHEPPLEGPTRGPRTLWESFNTANQAICGGATLRLNLFAGQSSLVRPGAGPWFHPRNAYLVGEG